MPVKAPLAPCLGRPPVARTLVLAIGVMATIAVWRFGLGLDTPGGVSAGASVPYVLAFGLTIWLMIQGSSLVWRWFGWLSDRLLPERVAGVLHWLIPVIVAVLVLALVQFFAMGLLAGDGSHPIAAAAAPLAGITFAVVSLVLAVLYAIRGAQWHRERVQRARWWLRTRGVAGRNEAARWESAWREAATVAMQLRRGETPAAVIPTDVMTWPDEQVFLDGGFEYARYYDSDASYVHGGGFYVGSPLFVVAGLAASAIGNAAARSRAAQESVARWREVQPARVLVTSQRLLVHTTNGWRTFDHTHVVSFYPEPADWYMVVEYDGSEPVRLSGMGAPHAMVLLASILHGRGMLDEHPAFAPLRAGDV